MLSNDFSKKIKQLRSDNGLTLEQVAKIVGVGKSTVRKWETGMIANMKRDKISLLAKALNVSPAYLMGWDEKAEEKPLSEGEKRLLELFRQIPEEKQKLVLEMIKVALSSK